MQGDENTEEQICNALEDKLLKVDEEIKEREAEEEESFILGNENSLI